MKFSDFSKFFKENTTESSSRLNLFILTICVGLSLVISVSIGGAVLLKGNDPKDFVKQVGGAGGAIMAAATVLKVGNKIVETKKQT